MTLHFTNNHWLNPGQQQEVCEALVYHGLFRVSNLRDLPLKGGGHTDVYIDLREARSRPKAIADLAHWFESPLRWCRPDRLAEVPDAISCFAGALSIRTDTPLVTVREAAKEGRVAKGKIIGNILRGDIIPLLDDVITDGESKVVPYRELTAVGAHVPMIVVLVDREQGWRESFAQQRIPLNVWSGMTLHHFRRFLVENGHLERCPAEIEKRNPIIVALDNQEWGELLPILDQLRPTGCTWKVNDLLGERGFELISNLSVYGRVMADLKVHDIPNTVVNVCRRLRQYNPWAVTVHGSGGGKMVEAAVKELNGTDTLVLVITVLTSIDEKTCEEVYNRKPMEEVRALAKIAQNAGAHGLVCSPEEVSTLQAEYPKMQLVVPGVRSPGVSAGDQKRIGTPKATLEQGASRIVMGRQILGADDPPAEVHRVLTQELGLL